MVVYFLDQIFCHGQGCYSGDAHVSKKRGCRSLLANAQAWYGFLQNVYKFLSTASYQKRARTLTHILVHILCHIFSDKVVTMLLYTYGNCKVIFYILCMYSVLFCVVKGRKEGFLELVVMCQIDKFATAQIVPSAPGGC